MRTLITIVTVYFLLSSSCTLTTTAPADQGPKQSVGTVTGMLLGGKVASDLAEDSSNKSLWTIAGVTLGAFLGNEIGSSMDKTDILMAQNATTYALENNKTNSKASWDNPDSGNSGSIYPTKTYSLGDQPCREFTQEINIGGKAQVAYGKACRKADGIWQIQ
jgi:surface antigen